MKLLFREYQDLIHPVTSTTPYPDLSGLGDFDVDENGSGGSSDEEEDAIEELEEEMMEVVLMSSKRNCHDKCDAPRKRMKYNSRKLYFTNSSGERCIMSPVFSV